MPKTTVEIGVYLTTPDAPYFKLNDPVRGKLNNTSYRLAGAIFYDITDKTTGVSIKRGKNRELDRYSSGNVVVSLNNEDRSFDPLNTDSIFYGNIIPRRQIRVKTSDIEQFNGVVEDWNFDYDVSGRSTASITGNDGLTIVAQQELTAGTATAQKTGARIEAVLSQPSVAWPLDNRNIDTGNSDLGADIFDGNALSYLQTVEASEQGQMFITRDGVFRFVNGAVTPTSGAVLVTFADDGTGIPYTSASVSYGSELLFNHVNVTYTAGTAVADNTASQDKYGIIATDVKTLLPVASTADGLAEFWVARYGEPEYRFENLTISLDGISGSEVLQVLNLDLGDIIQIVFTPNGVGAPIERYGQIISLGHDIKPGSHNVNLGIGSLQFAYLVLDDDGFGILDENVLAF